LPRYAAERVLLAPIGDVWSFVAEPYHLSDWWPGISGVEPDRRGLAAGARWKVLASSSPGLFRKPESSGVLVVRAVVPRERISFQLTRDRIGAELELAATDEDRTRVTLTVEGPFLVGLRRRFPEQALSRLYDLVQTAGEP
jgi:uncharacterized protein YndB with AHSA1/START domain